MQTLQDPTLPELFQRSEFESNALPSFSVYIVILFRSTVSKDFLPLSLMLQVGNDNRSKCHSIMYSNRWFINSLLLLVSLSVI